MANKSKTERDRIRELEKENSRLRKELEELREMIQADLEEQLKFNRMYKGD
jgi:chaperonin cofactor prefoldin